ncbi:MAG: AAA-like domain-containing protein [Bacteroidales bacterium]|nr:AAA-like domain-containing protein [Bacteroidales bacterium]
MARQFNTAVTCDPKRHYMVDISNKMKVLERLINNGNYFTINRARQFGKSTSLKWIYNQLNGEYLVVSLSFETTDKSNWEDNKSFYDFFCKKMIAAFKSARIENTEYEHFWMSVNQVEKPDFQFFSEVITQFCEKVKKKIVLLIDEVDQSLDNELFVRFLSMLRNKYIDRDQFGDNSTFWSVVLAGVYDIKSMKVKIRPDEDHKYNSPWNVAANYKLDMTFNPQEISTMLTDYESENHIGFDINEISEEIYKYTSGYPVLVSGVCKEIDENLDKDWSKDGVLTAVNNIIKDNSAMLFKDITKNIENNSDLKKLLRAISLENFKISYYADIFPLELGRMFSLLKADKHSCAQIHNLIFQQRINNYFIAENQFGRIESNAGPSVYTDKQGDLNMPLIINRFADIMKRRKDIKESDDGQKTFLEREGRFMFICFLKPILNGTGFYYSEPENDDGSRMDLVITFNHKEYVIELKIWHGTEYEISGRDQLSEYLETRNLSEGYLITFSFLKGKSVQEKPEWIEHNGKRIYEAVI